MAHPLRDYKNGHLFRITVSFAASYDFLRDFSGTDVPNVICRVLLKSFAISELAMTLSSLYLVVNWPVFTVHNSALLVR